MTARELRERTGLSTRNLANALHEELPKLSAAGVSMAERPDKSGLTYTAKARALIEGLSGYKAPKRKTPCRISGRITKARRKALNMAMTTMGHSTMQQAVNHMVDLYLDEAREKVEK